MGPYEYLLIRIDGDYALLQRIDQEDKDVLPIARALLPPEAEEGLSLIHISKASRKNPLSVPKI